jgi:PAS domain-containing protein
MTTMISSDASAEINSAQLTDERREHQQQLLQDLWLLTLFMVLLATALPWFISSFEIDFAAASWVLLALGAIYVGLTLAGHGISQGGRARLRIVTLLHAAGVVALGLLWQRCGGLQNPAFLLAFALPVIAAGMLSRFQPYATALLAMLVVAAVALTQAPELRWYAGGLSDLVRTLTRALGGSDQGSAGPGAFPGFYAPVGYDIVLLEVFGLLIFACAVASESLGNAFDRMTEHLSSARAEADSGQQMWSALVRQLPVPALLVDAETQQIVLSSERLAPFRADANDLVGRPLLEAMRFSYPERLQELIAGEGGIATAVAVHVGDELRMASVRVRHVTYEGRRLALLLLEDTMATFCVTAALDAEERAALVINERGRIVAMNKAAAALLPEAALGHEANRALARSGGTPHWWEPGVTGRRRIHVTLARRAYLATATQVAVPGEQEAMYVLTFTPLLPASDVAESAVGALR